MWINPLTYFFRLRNSIESQQNLDIKKSKADENTKKTFLEIAGDFFDEIQQGKSCNNLKYDSYVQESPIYTLKETPEENMTPSSIEKTSNFFSKIYDNLPSAKSSFESSKDFLDKKINHSLKNVLNQTTQSIKKVSLLIFRIFFDYLKYINHITSEDINTNELQAIKKYFLKISPSNTIDSSKYLEIKEKYQKYLKNKQRPKLNSEMIYFDDISKEIYLTIYDLENFNDFDPISKTPIIEVLGGMETMYKFFGVLIEIKRI